jgi:glycosyltransferase involved in cell wall biosynthesis
MTASSSMTVKLEGGTRLQGVNRKSEPGKPLITIITVVFNGSATLENTIRCVARQTYDNVEYIIIDGASADGTLDIIKKHEHIIDYWLSEPDCGIYDAFNKAISRASGDYYLVLGCDDELFEDAIQQVVNTKLKYADVDFVVASMWLGNKLRKGMRPHMGWLGAHAMVNGHSVGMLIRTKVHDQLGLYATRYALCADGLFIKKLFSSGFRGVESDVVMGRFSTGGASNSNIARGLCEGFLVQLETEKHYFLQVLIFIVRLIKNCPRL